MCMLQHKFANILKGFDEHEGMWMNHSHFSIIPCQFATPLNEARVKVAVKLQWLFIVLFNKCLQLCTKVATIRIGWISHHHIERVSNYIEEGHCLTHLQQCVRIPVVLAVLVHEVMNLLVHFIFLVKQIFHLFFREERMIIIIGRNGFQLFFQPNQSAELVRFRQVCPYLSRQDIILPLPTRVIAKLCFHSLIIGQHKIGTRHIGIFRHANPSSSHLSCFN